MSKILILKERRSIDLGDLDRLTPEQVAEYFQGIAQSFEKQFAGKDMRIEFERDPFGYDGGCDFYWAIYRRETDKEYKARSDKEQKAKEKAAAIKKAKKEKALAKAIQSEAEERELYEKLKRKFG